MTDYAHDYRPCKGDAFQKAGPRLRRLDCDNCARFEQRGGKCLGRRGFRWAEAAGIRLEERP
jgi:hypothetical protein